MNAALIGYCASSAFTALGESTRNKRRRILENFHTTHGDKRMALMPGEALRGAAPAPLGQQSALAQTAEGPPFRQHFRQR
jgi:hypothetical protein